MFRNKEFRCFAVLFFVLAIAGLTAGFAISFAAGILALTLSAVFGISFTVFTKQRYRSLARLSMEIDLILHDEDRMELDAFEEGELSILHSEVNKMTLRIREQNEALKKDKQHLTDSLADIAHQLRTPLTSATLALSLLKKTLHEESLSGVNADEIKLEWENKVRRLKKERQKFIYETEKLLAQMDWLLTSLLKLSR
ncbi:MAG: hypothetical protein LBR54_03365, partial [Oscillospiraceae bacterium]|nr:hypothetical protein [Oscillospiraceae bacterium]